MRALALLFVRAAVTLLVLLGASFVGVALTGPSVRAGERAVLVLGALHLVIALISLFLFVRASGGLVDGAARVVLGVVYAGLMALEVLAVFFVTVVALNR